MLKDLDINELLENEVYYSIYPFDIDLFSRYFAQLTALTANCYRDPKKRSTPFTENDFTFKYGEQLNNEPQTMDEQTDILAFMANGGGK